MSVVANVAVNLDATSVVQRLKQIQGSAIGAGDAFKKLTASAQAVKSAVEASGGGFAKASTVVGVFAAKVKNTENAIRAQIAALKQVQASVQIGGALYQKAAGQIKQYEDALHKASGAGDDAGGGIDGLKGKIAAFVGGLALAATAVNVVKSSLNAAFERGQAETRLRALTSAYGETAEATNLAAAASNKFGLTQTEATKAIGDVYGRLRPLGFSLKQISGVYDGFNTLTMQAGLSSAEASSVFTQLSQALGSGTLRGDEFNRMAESMPAILGVVAKELGVSQNALRGMAADGKISADVVVSGLKKVADAGGNLDDFLDPSTKAMNELAKNTEDAQVAFGNLLKPAAIAALNGLSEALKFTVKYLKQIAQTAVFFATFAGTLKLIALGTQAWATASKALAAGQKAAGVAAAFLQGVMNPASLATTALALGAAASASVLLGKAMDSAAADAERIDPAAQKAAKATTAAAEASRKMKEALEVAKAKAADLAIEMQTRVVFAVQAATAAINAQLASLELGASISAARYSAEKAILDLTGQQLEREYNLANTAQQRLNIAARIFNNSIALARIETQQAIERIKLDQAKIRNQVELQKLKWYEIKTEGELQILKAKDAKAADEKRQQLSKALLAQGQVLQAAYEQVEAQREIGKYQETTLNAQYQSKVLAAQTAFESKLVSKEIGLSQDNAVQLSNNLASSSRNTSSLSGYTQQVARNAAASADMFVRVATSAEVAANNIRNAANQQARLNFLRGQQSTGNATTRPVGAAQGAYWPGGFQAFAKGGIVTKPTLGLVGEGGEPEYIIPQSKMAAASANYLSGARGASVIPSGNAQINVTTGPVMQQGGQQYVSMADLERAMRKTADGIYSSLRTPAGRYAVGVR